MLDESKYHTFHSEPQVLPEVSTTPAFPHPPFPSYLLSRFRLLNWKDQLVVINSEIIFLIAIFGPHIFDVKQR